MSADTGISERRCRPSATRVKPSGSLRSPFVLWWVCDWLRVFRGRDYSVLLIYDNDVLVHRSCGFPKFIWFPLMRPRDGQIGDVCTAPGARARNWRSRRSLRYCQSSPRAPSGMSLKRQPRHP